MKQLNKTVNCDSLIHKNVNILHLLVSCLLNLVITKIDNFFYEIMLKKEACLVFYVIIITRHSIEYHLMIY